MSIQTQATAVLREIGVTENDSYSTLTAVQKRRMRLAMDRIGWTRSEHSFFVVMQRRARGESA